MQQISKSLYTICIYMKTPFYFYNKKIKKRKIKSSIVCTQTKKHKKHKLLVVYKKFSKKNETKSSNANFIQFSINVVWLKHSIYFFLKIILLKSSNLILKHTSNQN
jgi:hypothetical protein